MGLIFSPWARTENKTNSAAERFVKCVRLSMTFLFIVFFSYSLSAKNANGLCPSPSGELGCKIIIVFFLVNLFAPHGQKKYPWLVKIHSKVNEGIPRNTIQGSFGLFRSVFPTDIVLHIKP